MAHIISGSSCLSKRTLQHLRTILGEHVTFAVKLSRAEYPDSLPPVEFSEVFITTHDDAGTPVQRKFQEHIVVGVTAFRHDAGDRNMLGRATNEEQKIEARFLRWKIAIQQGLLDLDGKLLPRIFRNDELVMFQRAQERLATHGIRQNRSADERIRIKDDARPTTHP